MFAKDTYIKPDFAYPKTVMANSRKNLEKAINDGNGIASLRYAIDLSIAQSLIDSDSINSILNQFSRIADDEKRPEVKALMRIFLADTYTDLYVDNRYVYDNRQQPLSPLPDDYRLWSAEQFKATITSLCNLALEDADLLKACPIDRYRSVISVNSLSATFYPTLFDFVANRAIENLSNLTPASLVFSARWLCRYDLYEHLQFPYANPIAESILSLYARLLAFHEGNPAPFVITDVNRIDFVAENVKADKANELAFQSLLQLYQLLGNSKYAGEALIAMEQYLSDINSPDVKTMFSSIEEFLKRHPNYFRSNALRNIKSRFSVAEINVSAPSAVAPKHPFSVKVHVENANQYSLAIYRVPFQWSGYSSLNRISKDSASLVATIRRDVSGNIPFATDNNVDITLPDVGCYIIVPALGDNKPELSDNKRYSFIHCSGIGLAAVDFADKQWAMAIEPISGAPVAGTSLQILQNKTLSSPYVTDSDGIAALSNIKSGARMFAKKDIDSFAAPITIYRAYYNNDTATSFHINLLTDLAVYRPGDTMNYSGVGYSVNGNSHNLMNNTDIIVTLRDANYQVKDTAIVHTDSWGRFEGSFTLPAEGLTGNFHLEARKSSSIIGHIRFMVSEYKLPTFQVEVTDILRNNPDSADVTIRGKACAYSGFPLAGCNVSLDLSVAPRYWWRSNNSYPYQSLATTTDAEGCFSLSLPAALLDDAPIADGIFNAQITVTSSIGESQSTSTRFTQGPSFIIETTIADNSDIDVSKPLKLDARLVDLMDKLVDAPIHYSIMQADKIVRSGTLSATTSEVDWSNIPTGSYSLELSATDADTVTKHNIGLYRPSDAMPPKAEPIWIPIDSYTTKSNHASILYGTTAEKTFIRYVVWTHKAILSQGWIVVPAGMHHFDYTMPDSIENLSVSLMASSDFKNTSKTISLRTEQSIKDITIVTESFRDHITPGAEERWTFRVKDHSGAGVHAAMIFDMYSKALDALSPMYWNFNVQNHPLTQLHITTPSFHNTFRTELNTSFTTLETSTLDKPEFETWGYTIGASNRIMGFGSTRLYKSQRMLLSSNASIQEDSSYDLGAAVEATAEAEESATDVQQATTQSPFTYRDAEVPLAFFRPMLTTDENGSLEFSFTAPNANTTWHFVALAFASDLRATTLSREVTANKPVMVQPNLPRFLRSGDCATIEATVMNNSDSMQIVVTTVEIFDPSTNRIISSELHPDLIVAGGSTTVTIKADAPMKSNMIGYRIKSSTSTFADGEQSIIPILEAYTPVINTKSFYIGADQHSFAMTIPEEIPNDATVTLEFCENPIWYCVTALPGLRAEEQTTSMGAATALFSAAVAEGIIRNNTSIARALLEWQSSDKSDSTLVSMLQRNQDLKTVLLNSTPWVMDARSDTERMTRLSLLFDKNEIEKVYASAIHRLAQLQRNGGGWAWIDESTQTSEWATYNILCSMGRLRQLGYLPANKQLEDMLANAVKYIDTEAVKAFKEYPKADYTNYVMTRDFYSDIKQSTAASRVTTAVVQRLVSDWKERTIHGKAVAAMILNAHDYNATARQILESLNEYAQYTPQRGMWWPTLDNAHYTSKIGTTSLVLDAYNAIVPSSREVDRIRQWLILQKQATNWGTSQITSDVIASILTTGSEWTRPAVGAVVKVGGETIDADRIDAMLGYFRTPIASMHPAGKELTVAKSADYPSWGAIYCQFIDEMTNVAQQESDDVSIEKQFYVRRGSEWVVADTLSVGDRVKVELIVHANRDMDYVAIIDDRAACFEPTEQLPTPIYSEGVYFYRENRDASTTMFVSRLRKGIYRLGYELYVNNAGVYTGGIASIQSQYAPSMSAHSSGRKLTVAPSPNQ